MRPLLVVELDGESHEYNKVKARDEMLNGIYEKVGLKYEHVLKKSNPEKKAEEIKDRLEGKKL
jgi:very-short-patch-repair endonuclease